MCTTILEKLYNIEFKHLNTILFVLHVSHTFYFCVFVAGYTYIRSYLPLTTYEIYIWLSRHQIISWMFLMMMMMMKMNLVQSRRLNSRSRYVQACPNIGHTYRYDYSTKSNKTEKKRRKNDYTHTINPYVYMNIW